MVCYLQGSYKPISECSSSDELHRMCLTAARDRIHGTKGRLLHITLVIRFILLYSFLSKTDWPWWDSIIWYSNRGMNCHAWCHAWPTIEGLYFIPWEDSTICYTNRGMNCHAWCHAWPTIEGLGQAWIRFKAFYAKSVHTRYDAGLRVDKVPDAYRVYGVPTQSVLF